jgi:predicted xylose isomerase-like sugar epimerase
MDDHTPTPWIAAGHSDFRGADNHLIGMVNPTGGGVSPKRAKADRALILRAVNSHDALLSVIETASHALRSYQYGNSATDLAEEIANVCDAAVKEATGQET